MFYRHQCPCFLDGLAGKTCSEKTEMFCVNQCSGHGECIRGWCKCQKGYFGTDCAHHKQGANESKGMQTSICIEMINSRFGWKDVLLSRTTRLIVYINTEKFRITPWSLIMLWLHWRSSECLMSYMFQDGHVGDPQNIDRQDGKGCALQKHGTRGLPWSPSQLSQPPRILLHTPQDPGLWFTSTTCQLFTIAACCNTGQVTQLIFNDSVGVKALLLTHSTWDKSSW